VTLAALLGCKGTLRSAAIEALGAQTSKGFWTCFSRAAMDGSLFRSSVAA